MSEPKYCFRGKKPCGCVIYLMMDYPDAMQATNEGARIADLMRNGVVFDYVPADNDHPQTFTRCADHANDEERALARLRDAAPDMLTALKEWVDYFDELTRYDDPGDPLAMARMAVHGNRIAMSRAAIAKAEARQ